MGKKTHIAGAARYARGLALLCALAASACARRPLPPSGSVQAVELTPEERLGIDDVFEVRVLGEPDVVANPYPVLAALHDAWSPLGLALESGIGASPLS